MHCTTPHLPQTITFARTENGQQIERYQLVTFDNALQKRPNARVWFRGLRLHLMQNDIRMLSSRLLIERID